jgi:organic hydroperoxide reductase OsmC/OhrA
MKKNISFRDRTFRILLAIVAVILFEQQLPSSNWRWMLLAAAVFLVITAAVSYCPVYSLLGIRNWEVTKQKFDRLAGKSGYHHYYHVNVAWNKNRQGVLCSPELNNAGGPGCIEVATPPQFPKGVAGIWSPEHLFTAAVSSCLMTTFLAVAEKQKLKFLSFSCPSEGRLERRNGNWMMTEVILHPTVTVPSDAIRELGLSVINESVNSCLISNSIKSHIVSKPIINVANVAAEVV